MLPLRQYDAMERLILSPSALEDLRRLYSYGWLPGRIAHILNRMHGLDLTPAEIKHFCRYSKALLETEPEDAPEDEPDNKPEEEPEDEPSQRSETDAP